MKKIKRAMHFDFHTLPGIESPGKNIDPEKTAQQLSEANVDYVNITARCNIGYSYYPTKLGEVYPGLDFDLCGELVKALKKRNIGVTLYLNGGLNHVMMTKNPGIMKISKDGRVYTNPDNNMNFFRSVCYNSEFRAYLIEEIKEILAMDPDGIFVDCLIPRSCYCPRCIEKMRLEGIDISDDEKVYEYSVRLVKDVMSEIRRTVPENKRLFLNSFVFDDIHSLMSHYELECLPTDPGEWGYDFIGTTAPYMRKFTDDLLYMTGCFTGTWGDFGGKKTKASIENDVYDALLYGYAPSVGDHIHPVDGINERVLKDIGEIYTRVSELEKWNDGALPVCDTAIIRNKCTGYGKGAVAPQSLKGASRMLSELKICFDIVNEDMCFDTYKLLVIPEGVEITEKLSLKLRGFNGSVISCGDSFRCDDCTGFFEAFYDENTDGYYEYDGEVFGQYSTCVKMKSEYSFADYVEPYFKKEFDGIHAYYYNPPKSADGYCSVALNEKRAHIGFRPFEAYLNYGAVNIKYLVKDILEKLLPKPLIGSTNLPVFARTTLMKSGEGVILHVKTTVPEHRGNMGMVEEHMSVPGGKKVCVLGEYKNVCSLPCMEKCDVSFENGYTCISLPEIEGYKSFLLMS